MPYSAETISEMMEAYGSVESRFSKLREDMIMRKYRTKRGQEFAVHGFCRRLHTLALTTKHVFEMLPPDKEGVPDKGVLDDVTIQIQAFVFNVSARSTIWRGLGFTSAIRSRRMGSRFPQSSLALHRTTRSLSGPFLQVFRSTLPS